MSTTPTLAIKDIRSRLPLLSRRGNLLADTLSLGIPQGIVGSRDGLIYLPDGDELAIVLHPIGISFGLCKPHPK